MKEDKIEKIEKEKKLLPIKSVEEYDKESDKIEALIDRFEDRISVPFNPFKKGFWESFDKIARDMYKEEIEPNLRPAKYDSDIETSRNRKNKEYNIEIRESFIQGSAHFYYEGLFSSRLLNRIAFYYLYNKNLLIEKNKKIFMNAMPNWGYGWGNPGNMNDDAIEAVVSREMENLKKLSSHPKNKEINTSLNELAKKHELLLYGHRDRFEVTYKKEDGSVLNISEQGHKELKANGIDPGAYIEFHNMFSKKAGSNPFAWGELSDEFGRYYRGITSIPVMMSVCEEKLKEVKGKK